jgi:hypothetical protein
MVGRLAASFQGKALAGRLISSEDEAGCLFSSEDIAGRLFSSEGMAGRLFPVKTWLATWPQGMGGLHLSC